ncbi:reverse transcriptase domain-containing protein [Tanacetum coccineum]|uniref:Reverse transcriptase domain-containing protein n=1 Tax=Tanacetum coccineum TaxID=301880 RepID=A0ABQ4WCI2_9ASTR
MTTIFHDMCKDFMEVFMDDFFVFPNSFDSCLNNLSKMLARCEETNLVFNWEKCHFMVKEGIVLGHKISKARIEVEKAKVDVILKLPYPTNIKGIRSFLGHAGFYRRFIKDFSKFARPMTQLLMKDAKFVFSSERIKSFDILRNKLTTAPVIIALNWDLDFELMCDASDYAVGAVLGQRVDKKFLPIYYASKTMNDAQEHYTTTEKELLEVVYAFDKFRSYLIMSKTVVYTDHSALKYLFSKQDAKPRLIRLENPKLEELDEDAIRDSFLDEYLMDQLEDIMWLILPLGRSSNQPTIFKDSTRERFIDMSGTSEEQIEENFEFTRLSATALEAQAATMANTNNTNRIPEKEKLLYVVPTGKDNFIVSAGRPNMVPAGRTIVSPGSIIFGPGG